MMARGMILALTLGGALLAGGCSEGGTGETNATAGANAAGANASAGATGTPAAAAAETSAKTASGTQAVARSPEEVIKARDKSYHQIGKAFKGIGDQLKKPEPELAVIRQHAATLDTLSREVNGWFPVGTGPDSGIKTAALPAIWERPAEFSKQAGAFAAAAHRLNLAAAGGDLAAVKAAVPAVGATCKSCHQSFNGKDDH